MRWELHAHTSESSRCGKIAAAEGVAMLISAGTDGVVITDHYNNDNVDTHPGSPRDKARRWLRGYLEAKQAGDRLGLRVLFGLEARLQDCGNDYLVFGAEPAFVLENPLLHKLTLAELKALCHANGALLIQVHPFREGCRPADPALVDGYEIYNGNPRHGNDNSRALELAEAHPELIRGSGSDFHRPEDLARGGIYTDFDIRTGADLADCLRSGRFGLICA